MITDVVLTGFGICQVTNEAPEPNQNSCTGYFLQSDTISFLDKTNTIDLKRGLRFGIEYLLNGMEAERAESFNVRIIHPLLVNPATGESATETVETKTGGINEPKFDYFHIEYDWEMIPGKWLFQVMQLGNILLEKEFNLYIQQG